MSVCVSVLLAQRLCMVRAFFSDQWAFCMQGAAQGQNALLPETGGDRKPGPAGTRRRGRKVSSTLINSHGTLPYIHFAYAFSL